ncbi:hypothetical protein E4U21_005042, partial [Claviceps maximensis]
MTDHTHTQTQIPSRQCTASTTVNDLDDNEKNQGSVAPTAITTLAHGLSANQEADSRQKQRQSFSLHKVSSAKSTPSLATVVPDTSDDISDEKDLERGNSSEDGTDRGDEKTGRDGTEDPDLVGWDGPNDAQNPKCWASMKKWTVVISVSCFTFISPVASSMVAPGLEAIGQDLNIEHKVERMLVMSVFLAAYALGPLVWGPLSELYGRVVVLQSSNIIFLVFNLGCGFAQTKSQMVAFRFLAGIGGSAPLAVGGGVLSDLFTAEERGRAMAAYSLMPLLGPAIGPVAGGWIAETTTWRWVFYSTTAACALVQVLGCVL